MDVILKEELDAIDLSKEDLLKSLENFPEIQNETIFTEYYNDRFEATPIKAIKNYSISVNVWFNPFQYGKYKIQPTKNYEGFEFSYENEEGEYSRIQENHKEYDEILKEFKRLIKCNIKISLTIKTNDKEYSTSHEIPYITYNSSYLDEIYVLKKELGFISREYIINKITNGVNINTNKRKEI